MALRIILIGLFVLCTSCKSGAQPIVVFRQGEVAPQVLADDASLASDFVLQFEKITGVKPEIVQSESAQMPVIALSKSAVKGFAITLIGNRLVIEGAQNSDIYAAISYFFTHFAGRLCTDNHAGPVQEIVVPVGFSHRQEYAFAYREPYFPDNSNSYFRRWHNTNTLDDNWELWGHNIGKKIKILHTMLATVDGKRNENQLCFTSSVLENALAAYIAGTAKDGNRHKFMIMPQDNSLVCQCTSCKAAGNTKTNAGPAVFTLLNRLAKKFPEQDFFSTAYITTQIAPNFRLEPNVGIMISTMPFQKGVVVENSVSQGKIDKLFADWQKVTDKIYLWEYAINFDNYFDAYPTLLIAQQNLKYYKKLGVSGVFINGNEESYSAFADLKAYIYAQLLQNPEIDVPKHIRLYFENKYPAVSNLLFDYYMAIEQRAFKSIKPLDIYGGISQSYKKYLNDAELKTFYEALADKAETLGKDEKLRLYPLLASLALQRLEVLRTNAFEDNGYADYNYEAGTATVKSKVHTLLKSLEAYSSATGLKVYNEQGFTIKDYLKQWQETIVSGNYKNLFYGKTIRSRFEPEEDYPDVSMLNDGNTGFTDYYTNWFIATKNSISVEVKPQDVKGVKAIEMCFLNDARHRIYLPEKVVVTIDGRTYEAAVPKSVNDEVSKVTVSLPIEIKQDDKLLLIEVIKYKENKNKSVACDEVYFK